ncbi:MAG: alpha-amylase [Nitrospira sp. LK70]|nr:alpha-amylase [Nitrospira sp. LK70]
MAESAFGPEIQAILDAAGTRRTKPIAVDGQLQHISVPFPSPADWRDIWIYFLMVDRFNNPVQPPASTRRHPPIAFDAPFDDFQGGTFEGVRQRLGYLRDLGVGAIWLSPVLKNCQYETGTFHGYGIQDFLHAEPRFSSNPAAARSNPAMADDELVALVDEIHARGMYAIFDIVLNHAGNVFGYVIDGNDNAPAAPFQSERYQIRWHDQAGNPAFSDFATAARPIHPDAAVWPSELQGNDRFRSLGLAADLPGAFGDFASLKQLVSENPAVEDTLIRAYQYVMAKFDCDGFRVDTFKIPNATFGHTFCASMREFGLSIGKENIFTFGEITVAEGDLRRFIGRDTLAPNADTIGIDAALDFPLEGHLGRIIKHPTPESSGPPSLLADMYQARKHEERTVITTHGEASGFFVTFLDNHDRTQRFFFADADHPHRFDGQLTSALAVLFGLQGIPCVYYGTEQGLHGMGNRDAAVREALWGTPHAFDASHPFYLALQQIASVRAAQPALRYGRQYFRPISGNRHDFGVSTVVPGVMAFSRILNAQEVLVVANTSEEYTFTGEVIVDAMLNAVADTFRVLYSNLSNPTLPGPLRLAGAGTVSITEPEGGVTNGPARVLSVTVQPLEVQLLRR